MINMKSARRMRSRRSQKNKKRRKRKRRRRFRKKKLSMFCNKSQGQGNFKVTGEIKDQVIQGPCSA